MNQPGDGPSDGTLIVYQGGSAQLGLQLEAIVARYEAGKKLSREEIEFLIRAAKPPVSTSVALKARDQLIYQFCILHFPPTANEKLWKSAQATRTAIELYIERHDDELGKARCPHDRQSVDGQIWIICAAAPIERLPQTDEGYFALLRREHNLALTERTRI